METDKGSNFAQGSKVDNAELSCVSTASFLLFTTLQSQLNVILWRLLLWCHSLRGYQMSCFIICLSIMTLLEKMSIKSNHSIHLMYK